MFAAYTKLLDKYPYLTKMLTSGTLFSLGDIITQKVVQKSQTFDYKRNFNLFIVGSIYLAPVLHNWYCKILPKIGSFIFNQSTPKTTRVFTSMAFDQFIFAPLFLSGFFIIDGITKELSMNGFWNGVKNYRQKIWETLKVNWMIWPVATAVNLWFMPVQYQVLFANFIGLFWNVILSYIANKPSASTLSQGSTVTQKLV